MKIVPENWRDRMTSQQENKNSFSCLSSQCYRMTQIAWRILGQRQTHLRTLHSWENGVTIVFLFSAFFIRYKHSYLMYGKLYATKRTENWAYFCACASVESVHRVPSFFRGKFHGDYLLTMEIGSKKKSKKQQKGDSKRTKSRFSDGSG